MPTLYVIPNWDRDFENARSRRLEKATFFCVQNHFDGKKIRRLQGLKNALELYGAFHAIAAVASKCWYRGVLLDDDGPISAQDLATKTGFSSKNFVKALAELSKDGVGLLKSYEIEIQDGKWVLPETVLAWATPQNTRAHSGALARTRAHSGALARTRAHSGDSGDSGVAGNSYTGEGNVHAHSGALARTRAHSRALARTQSPPSARECALMEGKGREWNGMEFPLPSPKGGREIGESVPFKNLPSKEKERLIQAAKARTCKLATFRGKDPTRGWSRDAMDYLTAQLPVPELEWTVIEWFHGLAPDDSKQELKNRRQSETTLWQFWPDEVTRALGYRQKNHAAGAGDLRKKEPERWRECLRWLHGDEIHLPETFDEVSGDLRDEYRRNFAAFMESVAGKKIGATE